MNRMMYMEIYQLTSTMIIILIIIYHEQNEVRKPAKDEGTNNHPQLSRSLSRVRKSENFPDSKKFVVTTFQKIPSEMEVAPRYNC